MSRHKPVLLDEVIESLEIESGMKVIDCTLGDGGHAEHILDKIGKKGILLGIDADPEAIMTAKSYLYRFENRLLVARDNFSNLTQIIKKNKFGKPKAILMDLGWSSTQFSERGRGFSFHKEDEELDMRFCGSNDESQETAADIINNYTEEELRDIFHKYGEEYQAKKLVPYIIKAREQEKIVTVGQLIKIVKKSGIECSKKLHPATKVFQSLRIAVNKELEVLRQALPQAVDALAKNGKLAVISFHSLEDRIVKQFFQKMQREKKVRIITKKPILPSDFELSLNPRARSAKMRVIERI